MKRIRSAVLMSSLIWALSLVATGCTSTKGSVSTEDVTEDVTTEAAEQSQTSEAPMEDTAEVTTEAEVTDNNIFKDLGLETFELTSEDLHDGVWDSVIAKTNNGSNVSPQLSWEPVADAACYVVYMVDSSASYWMHWKSNGVTEVNLPQGWASEQEYIGPYPPSGTHNYDVYVFALKAPVEEIKGYFNSSNENFYKSAMVLDSVEEGSSGNIISYGYISGTYTKGE